MRIKRIEIYAYALTYVHGDYIMSGGRRAAAQESTLVRLLTDSGQEGWGEVATLGSTYLPAFAEGARAAIAKMGPHLIGSDPMNLSAIHSTMDSVLRGHQYAKSPIDIACWDLIGQSAGLPVSVLLGGTVNFDFALYEAIPLGNPDDMAVFAQQRHSEGITAFQVKVGDEPREDAQRVRAVKESLPAGALVIADANGGWSIKDAAIAIGLMSDMDISIEQPCLDHHDNVLLRDLCRLPLILDESVLTTADLFRAKFEARAGSVNLKIGRLGGLTAAKMMRDVADELGISVCVEDTWGGDVTTAAVSHLAASTQPNRLYMTSFFNDWTNEHVAGHRPHSHRGRGSAPMDPGLGIAVDLSMLGKPIIVL